MELQTFILSNGIRLVHFPVKSPVAHCGIFIHAGSRDEAEGEHGIAHFIEHTIFKGTKKRNLFQILNRLENVGADLNAYTTKEETCIHASFLTEFYDRTLELFQDIFFNSVFPEKELEREKQVVLDEIRSYQDTPGEQISDDFEDFIFAGHPLGKNILGSARSLNKIAQKDILDFIHRNYRFSEVVIASVGDIDFKKLVRLAGKYFSFYPDRGQSHPRIAFQEYHPFVKIQRKRTSQVHCVVGAPAYAYGHERRIPLAILNNMLGGPVMNSRLSLALRERNGLTYHNESNYSAYSDAGIVNIYFGTDRVHYEKALEIVHKELKRLREVKLSQGQLHTIKKQIIGQLAIAQESHLTMMLTIGKSYLLQNRFDPIATILERIRITTAEELIEIANEIYEPARLSMLTFKTGNQL
ncbi:MAG: pitrilysin family protein [Bacteroidales bacterium]|nr:pitrilysin family protein [Bacteroidales bacterium]